MKIENFYHLVCITCKELIDESDSISKLQNYRSGLIKERASAHYYHKMKIYDDIGIEKAKEEG